VSAADDPRSTILWRDTVIAARTVIEDSRLLPQADADRLAEAVSERLLGDFLAEAEARSLVSFTPSGAGPVCSWCRRPPGPMIPKDHFQYGIFCDCKRPEDRTENEEQAV
jgi:hypothetical protein